MHTVGGKRNSARKTDKYFSELTKTQVNNLYELYKLDFKLFGYDHQKYIELAKNDAEEKVKKKDEFDLALEELKFKEKGNYSFNKISQKKRNQNERNQKNLGKFRIGNQNKRKQNKESLRLKKGKSKHKDKVNNNKTKKETNSTGFKNKIRKQKKLPIS